MIHEGHVEPLRRPRKAGEPAAHYVCTCGHVAPIYPDESGQVPPLAACGTAFAEHMKAVIRPPIERKPAP